MGARHLLLDPVHRTVTLALDGMRLDKKSRGSPLRFVVLSGLAAPTLLAGPDEAVLRASYEAIAE